MTDLTAERTRKLAAEAQLAEMELAKARHEYVAVADVANAWGEVSDCGLVDERTAEAVTVRHGWRAE